MRIFIPLLLIVLACSNNPSQKKPNYNASIINTDPEEFIPDLIADGFDFPVGPPDGKGYYNAQGFGKNNHLGDDWNGLNGGNSDLGDPVYVIGNGLVTFVEDYNQSWGNVIRVTHYLADGTQFESLYGHCDKVLVKKGDWIEKGTQIGTIGTAHGVYSAHLHLEIRDNTTMSVGPGYSLNSKGYLNPTKFINEHRVINTSK